MVIPGRGAGGLELPIPSKDINATTFTLKELLTAVHALEKAIKDIVALETKYNRLIIKYANENVDPKLWSAKAGLFSKSPHHQCLALFDKAQKLRPVAQERVIVCMKRLSELGSDVNYITARIIAPWTVAEGEVVGDFAAQMEKNMRAWAKEMDAIEEGVKKKRDAEVRGAIFELKKRAKKPDLREQAEELLKAA